MEDGNERAEDVPYAAGRSGPPVSAARFPDMSGRTGQNEPVIEMRPDTDCA